MGGTISPKISFGINPDFDFNDEYYSIIFEFKTLFIRESKSPHENYNFIELQAGCTPIPKNAFLLGAESDLCFIKRREGRKLDP